MALKLRGGLALPFVVSDRSASHRTDSGGRRGRGASGMARSPESSYRSSSSHYHRKHRSSGGSSSSRRHRDRSSSPTSKKRERDASDNGFSHRKSKKKSASIVNVFAQGDSTQVGGSDRIFSAVHGTLWATLRGAIRYAIGSMNFPFRLHVRGRAV